MLETFFGDHFSGNCREDGKDGKKAEPSGYVDRFCGFGFLLSREFGGAERAGCRGRGRRRCRGRRDGRGEDEEKNRSCELGETYGLALGDAPSSGRYDARNENERREGVFGIGGTRFAESCGEGEGVIGSREDEKGSERDRVEGTDGTDGSVFRALLDEFDEFEHGRFEKRKSRRRFGTNGGFIRETPVFSSRMRFPLLPEGACV